MRPAESGDQLNPRELEVLQLASKGCSNKDIARLLDLSHHTVNDYLRRIFTKLDVNSRIEAAVIAVRKGLL